MVSHRKSTTKIWRHTFSQIGYGPNVGIVPISCAQIFERINKLQSDTVRFEVNFSILEIYNERVQDLLVDPSTRP